MAAECGLPYNHDWHLAEKDGVIIACDGDKDRRPNYDGSQINKPS